MPQPGAQILLDAESEWCFRAEDCTNPDLLTEYLVHRINNQLAWFCLK